MFISSVTYAVVGFGEAGCPHPKGTRRLSKPPYKRRLRKSCPVYDFYSVII
jgi:hypothetical protein